MNRNFFSGMRNRGDQGKWATAIARNNGSRPVTSTSRYNNLRQITALAAEAGENHANADDFIRKRSTYILTQRPPRSLGNQIFWVKFSVSSTHVLNNLAPPNENNSLFNIASLPGSTNYLTVFDQYCIYSICIVSSFGLNNNVGTGSTTIIQHSAIDYDNVNAIGSLALLQGYESYGTGLLTSYSAKTSSRSFYPCLAPLSVNPTLPAAALVARSWVDSGFNDVPHYGVRYMYELSAAGTTYYVDNCTTVICGFRNSF